MFSFIYWEEHSKKREEVSLCSLIQVFFPLQKLKMNPPTNLHFIEISRKN
jgi:hypothetical protein